MHTYLQTVHGKVLREADEDLAEENHRVVQRAVEEQFRGQGFTIGRGTYALSENLTLYRSTSDRIRFKDRKAFVVEDRGGILLRGPEGESDNDQERQGEEPPE
jgi:hypothetical protein